MVNAKNKRTKRWQSSLITLVIAIAGVVLLNWVSSQFYKRFDLTQEKRYTISEETKGMLSGLEDVVYVKVYLEGEFPAGLVRLQKATEDLLSEFRIYSDKKVHYVFIDPFASSDVSLNQAMYEELIGKGLKPTNMLTAQNAGTEQTLLFPGAVISYKGREVAVQLLEEQMSYTSQEVINNSVIQLEYKMANAINKLLRYRPPTIAFTEGHGELNDAELSDIANALNEQMYDVDRISLGRAPMERFISINNQAVFVRDLFGGDESAYRSALEIINQQPHFTAAKTMADTYENSYGWAEVDEQVTGTFYSVMRRCFPPLEISVDEWDLLVFAKPTQPISDEIKYKIDQYIMNGGKVLWLIENVVADMDSLMNSEQTFYAMNFEHNLEDMLFKYGVRVNYNLVQDVRNNPILLTLESGGSNIFQWPYFPLLQASGDHPIVRNLDPVAGYFASTLDTIAKTPGITKQVLLQTSEYSKALLTPVRVHLSTVTQPIEPENFSESHLPVAILLEGEFPSVFSSRLSPAFLEQLEDYDMEFKEKSVPNKMIVISDGDIIKNEVRRDGAVLPLGFHRASEETFANKPFILNAVEYLIGDDKLLSTRTKEIKLRLLNKVKAEDELVKWRVINIVIPLFVLFLFVALFQLIRRYKYAR